MWAGLRKWQAAAISPTVGLHIIGEETMTKQDQIDFVNQLTYRIASAVIEQIEKGRIPTSWDGHQLRYLLALYFDRAKFSMTRGEVREFNNTVQVNDL